MAFAIDALTIVVMVGKSLSKASSTSSVGMVSSELLFVDKPAFILCISSSVAMVKQSRCDVTRVDGIFNFTLNRLGKSVQIFVIVSERKKRKKFSS